MKNFTWNARLMRRAVEEFPCLECGFEGDSNRPTLFHSEGCSRGFDLPEDVKTKRLNVWAEKLQSIIEEEEKWAHPKASERCEICRKRKATGTIWVRYHYEKKFCIVSKYPCCDDCSFIIPHDYTDGREWGFARGLVTEKNWELLNFLENKGVAW